MTIELVTLMIGLIGASFSYFIYPLILLSLPQKNQPREFSALTSANLPAITFIITAFNEESKIADKLENTLKVRYPREKLEILVASDGSTDRTNDIVREFEPKGVKLINVPDQNGKENAQKHAIIASQHELLVFSDVSTKIEEDALNVISQRFQDPKIGAISSEDRFITEDGKVAGEGAYVKYEMWLRKTEAKVNTLVGLSGSFFAARKKVCENWDINIPSDFNTALNCARLKLVAISEPELLGFYPNLKDETKEYQRKVRTVIRGIAALFAKKDVINPLKFGMFSFQIFGHKIMRWLVPWFLFLSFFANYLLLENHIGYKALMLAQTSFYLIALLGKLSERARQNGLIKIAYFFVQVNIAIAHASLQFLMGKRVTKWTPSKR